MKEDALDVLMYLFDHYLGLNPDELGDETTLAKELQEAGFELKNIHKAFTWLGELAEAQEENAILPTLQTTCRLFTQEESLKLNIEAQGYLLALEQKGVLKPLLREWVLERAMAIESTELGLTEFKRIIGLVLTEQATCEETSAFAERLIHEDIGGVLQ